MTKYYIQSMARGGYVGNEVLWWGKNSSGYVTDIKEAGIYDEEKAKDICNIRNLENGSGEIAWPVWVVEKAMTVSVDGQKLDHKDKVDFGKATRKKREKDLKDQRELFFGPK